MPPILINITRFQLKTHFLDRSVNPGGDNTKARGTTGVNVKEGSSTNYAHTTARGSKGHSPFNAPSSP